ncbi:hypothetical protein F4810DRAFT_660051 [Camillea tinctor]|nr:hypothetical protein F4810DRAFT_660051 [Camillea tinctor]
MFARCCRRQIWRVPQFLPTRGIYPVVRTINSSTATAQVAAQGAAREIAQETLSAVNKETPNNATPEEPKKNKYGRVIVRPQIHSPNCEFTSKVARFLDLEVVMEDPETSPFIAQYHPWERRWTYQQHKDTDKDPKKLKFDFRPLWNCEPNRKWKVKVYDTSLASIRKSIASLRQVRGHMHSALARVFNLNNVNLVNLGELSAPKPEDDGDAYPLVDFKDLRAWVERDGFNRPIVIWVSVAHLESENLADGQWKSRIRDPPPIWNDTLRALASGKTPTEHTDEFSWILERFVDTIGQTARSGPGRSLFRDGATEPPQRLPLIFSIREHYFWFLWENAPYGPMTCQYSGAWIPRIQGQKLPHEIPIPVGQTKPTKRVWTRTVQKRQTGTLPRDVDDESQSTNS